MSAPIRVESQDLARATLRDAFTLPLTRRAAFRLFTARGEELWVPGWSPEFFAEVADDLDIGTVFRTIHNTGRPVTWIVLDGDPPARVRYAVVVEAIWAGTVAVDLADTPDGCRCTVAYDLTATSAEGRTRLAAFASAYPEFLASWRDEIERHLAGGGALPDPV